MQTQRMSMKCFRSCTITVKPSVVTQRETSDQVVFCTVQHTLLAWRLSGRQSLTIRSLSVVSHLSACSLLHHPSVMSSSFPNCLCFLKEFTNNASSFIFFTVCFAETWIRWICVYKTWKRIGFVYKPSKPWVLSGIQLLDWIKAAKGENKNKAWK